MNKRDLHWHTILSGPRSAQILSAAAEHVAQGITQMALQPFHTKPPLVRRMDFEQIASCNGNLEAEAVGIYMEIESGLQGSAVLIIPLTFALNLVDLISGTPLGTAQRLDSLERSALAEVGNLVLSYFLNTLAMCTSNPEILHPTPPTVIVDMLGTILSVIITKSATVNDDMLIVDLLLRNDAETVRICFWVIPDITALEEQESH